MVFLTIGHIFAQNKYKHNLSRNKKLARFAEFSTFPNTYEKSEGLKSNWQTKVFNNNSPIVLELAAGKAEYTVGMSRLFPNKNFVAIDKKGNRLWVGAKKTQEEKLANTAFARTQIDFLSDWFGPAEVDEIWIIHPDPQIDKARKRLTGPMFIARYREILKPGGVIHLKTDSTLLYEYTLEIIAEQNLKLISHHADIYNAELYNDVLAIKTYYEQMFTAKGETIKYISFTLD